MLTPLLADNLIASFDAVAFVAGAGVSLVSFFAGYVAGVTRAKKSLYARPRAADGGVSAGEPVFTCDYHGIEFEDLEEARDHAVQAHGAPRDSDEAWRHTYPEGRE